jgi:hypothetical protein
MRRNARSQTTSVPKAQLADERGIMVMAVFGNIITSLSWFGVNMLGIGLHSYGFMDKAFFWLMAFIATQLAVMALGAVCANEVDPDLLLPIHSLSEDWPDEAKTMFVDKVLLHSPAADPAALAAVTSTP